MDREDFIEMLLGLFYDDTIEIIPHVRQVGPNGNSTQVDIEIRIEGDTVKYMRG